METYETGLTVMSAVIVIFAGWLAGMMLIRMATRHMWSGRDLASLTYVLGTLLVFLAIALRLLFDWPREVYFGIVLLKMLSVIAVTLWARVAMDDGG